MSSQASSSALTPGLGLAGAAVTRSIHSGQACIAVTLLSPARTAARSAPGIMGVRQFFRP